MILCAKKRVTEREKNAALRLHILQCPNCVAKASMHAPCVDIILGVCRNPSSGR